MASQHARALAFYDAIGYRRTRAEKSPARSWTLQHFRKDLAVKRGPCPDRCITRDTVRVMESVSVRDLRNHGGEVLDRVARGETVIVTRDGVEVAELRGRSRRGPSSADLIARRRHLPFVDPQAVRRDIDSVIDPTL